MLKNDVQKIQEVVEPVIINENIELVDIEYRHEKNGLVLRLFIDKEGGVSLADCEHISKKVGEILDREDIIHAHYFLEVSSPGLSRILKKESDFIRFCGSRVRINLYSSREGRKSFIGVLKGYSDNKLHLELVDGKSIFFNQNDICQVRLEPEI